MSYFLVLFGLYVNKNVYLIKKNWRNVDNIKTNSSKELLHKAISRVFFNSHYPNGYRTQNRRTYSHALPLRHDGLKQ